MEETNVKEVVEEIKGADLKGVRQITDDNE
jgi:hypothetical protein